MIHLDFKSIPSADLFTIPGFFEAESSRYGADAFMVLPLSSGRIAVLGFMRELHAICDTWEEAREAALSIPFNIARRATLKPKLPSKAPYTPPQGKALPNITLEDLGI